MFFAYCPCKNIDKFLIKELIYVMLFLQAYLRQIETKAVIPGRRRAGCKPGKKLKVQKVPPPTKIICI